MIGIGGADISQIIQIIHYTLYIIHYANNTLYDWNGGSRQSKHFSRGMFRNTSTDFQIGSSSGKIENQGTFTIFFVIENENKYKVLD